MREYAQALRAIWRCWEKAEPLDFRGEQYTFTLMTPNFVPTSRHLPRVPVTIAAVGAAMRRVAGEVGDGVRLHPFCARRYVDDVVMPALRAGLARAGRLREHFAISGSGFIATGPDSDALAEMVEWVHGRIAFCASTPAYWPVREAHGPHDLGRKLNAMSRTGPWDQMAREISDDVLGLFTAVGTHGELVTAVRERSGGAADAIAMTGGYGVRQDLPADVIQALHRIPSRLTRFPPLW